ncbi:MAG: CRISPR-associated endonuclease Cas1 [Candidatus Aenigmarchaeota archaeon]|nr:CRISPR-associated endonuclease Cas1 [Candidatus Aenigmarchaeota archaeon]
MKHLVLSGHGININVDNSRLHVKDGRNDPDTEPKKYTFKPKMMDFDNVIVYGHSGNITLEAMRWLVKQNVQLTLLDWNGNLLTSVMPPESKQINYRMVQYQAYQTEERTRLAKLLVDAKIKSSKVVLSWLKSKYPQISDDIEYRYSKLPSANSVKYVMDVEGKVAIVYWRELSKIFNKTFEFETRGYGKTPRPLGAVDPINVLLNYGYAVLESVCLKAINTVGLDPKIGFLHEAQTGKNPLVYDLQEPFRWIIDVAILNGLEKRLFKKDDFIRTENYNLRLRPSGAKKLVREIELQMNKTVDYRGYNYSWAYIIGLKALELAQYLAEKRKTIDFSNPSPELEMKDNAELRQKILDLSSAKAEKLGIGRNELHYLRKKAKSEKAFKIYGKVKDRLRC